MSAQKSSPAGDYYSLASPVKVFQVHKVIKLFVIKPSEFGHGKTRNFAVKQAQGNIIVFLSQDALPIGNDWLKNLIAPLEDAVGVFCKQVPYPKTSLEEKYFYSISYPSEARIMTKKDVDSFSNKNIFFSNVCGAVKKELLVKYPFRDDLIMSEDQFWGREVLKGGYKIIYEPKARVYHSHNYNLIQLFKRYYQSGLSQKQMNLKGEVIKKGMGTAFGLLGYVLKNKPLRLPYTIFYELVKGFSFLCGRYIRLDL